MKKILLFTFIASTFHAGISNAQVWGESDTRTEYRDNAGLQGSDGAKSGFFQTSNPFNYPAGASSWWHLLDVRHSNPNNNFAMQFAGYFWDQDLWFRKTSGNPAQAWSRVITEKDGAISWGAAKSFSSGQDWAGGYIELKGSTSLTSRIRLQSSRSGDVNNYSQFYIDPDNGFSFMSLGSGNSYVGIGTSTPQHKLHLQDANPVLALRSTSGDPWSGIRGNNDTWLFGYNGQAGSEDISIGTQDGSGTRTLTFAAGGTAKMKILSNGDVGIGTTQIQEIINLP